MSKQRLILASVIGPAAELYDFALFGVLISIIAQEFFPEGNLWLALATFSCGVFMRLVGGIFLGYVGDVYGRRKVLLISISAISLSTLCIGITPSYKAIGIYSTIIIVICRLIQGLCLGGEQTTASIFLVEHNLNRKYIYGSIAFLGLCVGAILANINGYLFTVGILPRSCWRIPFIMGLLIGFVGFYIRFYVRDSEVFSQIKLKGNHISLKGLMKNYKPSLVIAIGLGCYSGVLLYTQSVYFNVMLTQYFGYKVSDAILVHIYGLGILIIFAFLSGVLSERFTPYTMLTISSISGIIGAPIIYYMLSLQSFTYVVYAQLLLQVISGLFHGTIYGFLTNLFPVQIRCFGVSTGYSSGLALFGGATPIISNFIVQSYGNTMLPSLYLSFSALVALIVIIYSKTQHVRSV